MFTLEQVNSSALAWAGRLTDGYHIRFSYNEGMALYALSYIIRLQQGECLNAWALGVINHWGRPGIIFSLVIIFLVKPSRNYNDNISPTIICRVV